MLVSFVLTVYDKRPFLPHVLAAIDAQTGGFARQIVIVDDGSTDGSGEWLERYAADRSDVTLIRQANQGPALALNAGLARVSGEMVKLCDGDDVLLADATARLLDAIDRHGAAFAFSRMGRHGAYDPVVGPAAPPATADGAARAIDDPLTCCVDRPQTNPTALLATRAAIARSGGADPAVFIQDYSLELRLAATGRAVELDATIFLAPRQADGRLTANKAQVLHDVNFAVARFLLARPALVARYGPRALAKAAGRAVKFARRLGGETALGATARANLAARFGLGAGDPARWRATLVPFQTYGRVRQAGGGGDLVG